MMTPRRAFRCRSKRRETGELDRPSSYLKLSDGFNNGQGADIRQFNLCLIQDPALEAVGAECLDCLLVIRNNIHDIIEGNLLHLPDDFPALIDVKFAALL